MSNDDRHPTPHSGRGLPPAAGLRWTARPGQAPRAPGELPTLNGCTKREEGFNMSDPIQQNQERSKAALPSISNVRGSVLHPCPFHGILTFPTTPPP